MPCEKSGWLKPSSSIHDPACGLLPIRAPCSRAALMICWSYDSIILPPWLEQVVGRACNDDDRHADEEVANKWEVHGYLRGYIRYSMTLRAEYTAVATRLLWLPDLMMGSPLGVTPTTMPT